MSIWLKVLTESSQGRLTVLQSVKHKNRTVKNSTTVVVVVAVAVVVHFIHKVYFRSSQVK